MTPGTLHLGGGLDAWVGLDNDATFTLHCTFAAHSGGSSLHIECADGTLEFAMPWRRCGSVRGPGF